RFVLEKIGPPEVEEPPRSTPVAKEFEGDWKGDYELLAYPRKVTLTLRNHVPQPASAEFVIVGRKVNNVPVDRITQHGTFITIESSAYALTYEGRLENGEIHGTLFQGPVEVPLILRRPTETHRTPMKLSLILILSVDIGSLALSTHGQTMFRGNAAHTGPYSAPAPRQFHRVKLKFPTGNRIVASPVIQGGLIYFGSDDGNVYAVDSETGRQVWKTKTRGPVSATPAVVNGMLYVGSYDGNFYALNSETGELKWKFATGGERRFEAKGLHGMEPQNPTKAGPFVIFVSSPVVVENARYFGRGDGNV